MSKPSIAVVLNTLNEEHNLPFALGSVHGWADQLVVVDMHSTDRTREIAESFGAEVHLHPKTDSFDKARALGLAHARTDWILVLDADEMIPPLLRQRMSEWAAGGQRDIVHLPRLNYMMGAPILHTGWGEAEDRQPRFFRRGMMQTTETIHRFWQPSQEAQHHHPPVEPGGSIVHFNYIDSAHFFEKMNRYTSVEARQAFERGERMSWVSASVSAGAEFFRRYVAKRGYLDGWRGFYLSTFMATYRLLIAAKLTELHRTAGSRGIAEAYVQEAKRLLDQGRTGV